MNYNTDFGFAPTDQSEYVTRQEAYHYFVGGIDAPCVGNQDCQDGLACQIDKRLGTQSCRLPPTIEEKCHRSHTDQRCHFISGKGNKVLCKDSSCSPDAAYPPKPVDPMKCAKAQLYNHHDSGSMFCGAINQETGQFEQLPEKCCHPTMTSMWDLENGYATQSLGPQYYGMRF